MHDVGTTMRVGVSQRVSEMSQSLGHLTTDEPHSQHVAIVC